MSRSLLLKQKLLFGAVISVSLGLMTVILSNLILESAGDLFLSAVFTMLVASLCLTSLATGLGAAYPSFDEDNPARIAAGIGGTLNFFASAVSVMVIVAIVGLPHFVYTDPDAIPTWMTATAHGAAGSFALTISTTALSAGRRSLARREF